ncbi:MAG: type II toxin-antitoxin system prevent-host-death family antitoxin [Candidatus Hydrogenedentes bacterium]|nr:type II toxin-antitoxin system prevent-host-death family antitoxin [Candidatus Hydrogenedentota bacterium]
MESISLSTFRRDLSQVLDKVNDDHTPMLITRPNGRPVVIMSADDFHSYEETAYLMASPRNAERLDRAVSDIAEGRFVARELREE